MAIAINSEYTGNNKKTRMGEFSFELPAKDVFTIMELGRVSKVFGKQNLEMGNKNAHFNKQKISLGRREGWNRILWALAIA